MGSEDDKKIKKDRSKAVYAHALTVGSYIDFYNDGAADRQNRKAAIEGIAGLALKGQDITAAIPCLIKALNDPDDEIMASAARAFLRISVRSDISSAAPTLVSAINRIISGSAVTSFEITAIDCAASALVRHYLRTNQFDEAEKYLGRSPFVAAYLNESPQGYTGISPESDAFIISALKKVIATARPDIRSHFIEGLVLTYIEKNDLTQLCGLVRSDNAQIRNPALGSIHQMLKDFETAAALVPLLGKSLSDPATKDNALDLAYKALKQYPNGLDIGPLVPALGDILSSDNSGKRRQAAFCLQGASFSRIDLSPVVPVLEKAIHDNDAYTRTNAASALANARIAARSWGVLEELASGRNPAVKPDARKAILETIMNAAKTGKDISHLRQMLQNIGQNDKDASVRKIANDTLVAMKPEPMKR